MESVKYLRTFFKFVCFILVGVSIGSLIHRWVQNNDASSIGFKQYNDKKHDIYPTYSFCFLSTGNGALFTYFEMELMTKFLLHPADFELVMKGEKVFDNFGYTDFGNISGIRFEEYMVRLEEIVISLEFLTTSGHDYTYDNSEGHGNVTGYDKEWPFYISHVDPTTICFSRKSKYVQTLIRKSDAVLFSLEKMKKWNKLLYFNIYAHHPGQLTRVFDKPIFSTLLDVVNKENNHLIFSVSQVSVLRKRPNANFPCDPKLKDDELKFKQVVIDKVGCTPNYWGAILDIPGLPGACTRPSQMMSVYDNIESSKQLLNTYKQPCNEMRIVTSLQRQTYWQDSLLYLEFMYMDENYQEIVNHRDFTISSFFSNTGGFVGMILGYSLLQAPDEIGRMWDWFRARMGLGRNSITVE